MLYCKVQQNTRVFTGAQSSENWYMRVIGRIGNGVQVSDRTAAVRWSRSHLPLIERLRRGPGDEAESEDLPVKNAYLVLRTIRTAAHAKRVGGSAALESKGFKATIPRGLSVGP